MTRTTVEGARLPRWPLDLFASPSGSFYAGGRTWSARATRHRNPVAERKKHRVDAPVAGNLGIERLDRTHIGIPRLRIRDPYCMLSRTIRPRESTLSHRRRRRSGRHEAAAPGGGTARRPMVSDRQGQHRTVLNANAKLLRVSDGSHVCLCRFVPDPSGLAIFLAMR